MFTGLSVCYPDYSNTNNRCCLLFCGQIGNDHIKNHINFGDDPDHILDLESEETFLNVMLVVSASLWCMGASRKDTEKESYRFGVNNKWCQCIFYI